MALVLSGAEALKPRPFILGCVLLFQEKGFRFIGGTREQVDDSPHVNDPLAIKTYVGSSAGALISAYLASGHTVEDVISSYQMGSGLIKRPLEKTKLRAPSYFDIFAMNSPSLSGLAKAFFRRQEMPLSGGFETLLKKNFKINGLFTSKRIEGYLRKKVLPTNSFNELGVDFFAVATFLNHSRKAVFGPKVEYMKSPETSYINYATIESDSVAASVSLPPVYAPYSIKSPEGEDVFYFDGEIRDTFSTHVAADTGADLIISSYSIQPYHYTKEIGSLSNFGLPIIINQALYQVVVQKIIKSIQAREDVRSLINTVATYFKENNLPVEHGEALLEQLMQKSKFRAGVDYIYIHPQPQDYEMFFVDHFSLNPGILARIVKIGLKSALSSLRKFDF